MCFNGNSGIVRVSNCKYDSKDMIDIMKRKELNNLDAIGYSE